MDPMTIALISVGFLFAFIILGVHVGVALASISVIGIWAITGKATVAINLLQTTAYSAVMDYVFAVIPLFVLMGLFSTLSGATQELFRTAQFFLGRIRGGIGIATVFANAVFAAITGVSVASAAVFSKIAFPEMERLQVRPQIQPGHHRRERDPRDADPSVHPDDRLRRPHRAIDRQALHRRVRPRPGGDAHPLPGDSDDDRLPAPPGGRNGGG